MKVVAFFPKHGELQVVLVDGTRDAFKIDFYEGWSVGDEDRIADYVSIRKRVAERVQSWAPDAVCIAPQEPAALRGGARLAMFATAELRGVVAEASRSVCSMTLYRTAAKVSKSIGDRKTAEYIDDEAFWRGHDLPKKFRGAALIALSYMSEKR